MDLFGTDQIEPSAFLCRDKITGKPVVLLNRRVGLGNIILLLLKGAHVLHLVCDLSMRYFPVGRLDKAKFIYLCVC